MENYHYKDIFIQRKNSRHGFDEYPFNITTSSVVVIDYTGDLTCIQNSLFIDSLPPIKFAISSAHSCNSDFALNANFSNKSLSASYSISSSYVPNLYPVNLTGYTLTSSFNAYTSSNDGRVNSLTESTSSYVTIGQTSSMSVLSSSYALTASYVVGGTSVSSSWASSSISSSYSEFSLSSSYAPDVYFLKNTTVDPITTIRTYDSIFNPFNLTITSSSIFIIDQYSDYYVLGDLTNSGSIVVNGTLKIGGALLNIGNITGSGVIE